MCASAVTAAVSALVMVVVMVMSGESRCVGRWKYCRSKFSDVHIK